MVIFNGPRLFTQQLSRYPPALSFSSRRCSSLVSICTGPSTPGRSRCSEFKTQGKINMNNLKTCCPNTLHFIYLFTALHNRIPPMDLDSQSALKPLDNNFISPQDPVSMAAVSVSQPSTTTYLGSCETVADETQRLVWIKCSLL